jgi:hypothetical protein
MSIISLYLFQELGETETLGSVVSNEPTEPDPEDR